MWDLDTIVRDNNQSALDWMMRTLEVERAQDVRTEIWPLTMLAEKLREGPVNLDALIAYFKEYKTLDAFTSLIKQFIPEHEDEIMSVAWDQRAYKFCYFFSRKYYPLPQGAFQADISALVDQGLPVALMGLSYSTYHELDMRPGYQLLLSLVVYPYEGDERDEQDDPVPFNPWNTSTGKYKPSATDKQWLQSLVETLAIGGEWIAPMGFRVIKTGEKSIELREAVDGPTVKETIARTLMIAKLLGIEAKAFSGRTAEDKLSGARVPLLDGAKRIVGAEIASRIPRLGWSSAELHSVVDNTKYEGVGEFADWACSQTGCVVLDSNYEHCEYMEGTTEPIFQWSKENVDRLSSEWPKVKQTREKIDRIVQWIEANPPVNFGELLYFLLSKAPEMKRGRLNGQYDPMEHYCPLDQYLGEEEIEDEEEARAAI